MMNKLAKLMPDSIAGRAIAVLVIGLSLSHLASIATYHFDAPLMEAVHSDDMLDRLVSARAIILASEEGARSKIASLLSSENLAFSLSTDAPLEGATDRTTSAFLKQDLGRKMPSSDVERTRVTQSSGPAGMSLARIAMPLAAGQWLNAEFQWPPTAGQSSQNLILSTGVMAAAVLIFSALMIRAALSPLRALGRAAERLGVDVMAPPMSEDGPSEIRQAAHTFNEMQLRIKSLLAERTQMLAALSHDLRTSLTVMHLRTEFIEDNDLREKLQTNIEDMKDIIVSTLTLLRDEQRAGETETINLVQIVRDICVDFSDAGRKVTYNGLDHVTLTCHPTSLKRAFTNLIDNALKYGNEARVGLERGDRFLLFHVADSGPGIAPDEMAKVFTPFYRVEPSRNQETGGFGLGLAIARSVARSHGGDIELENLREGGLRVTLRLPIHTSTPA